MKISGFTMVRNAEKYYFPVKESIESVLPLVDEFIVALGDSADNTRQLIESIGSEKIRIYDRIWSESDFINSRIFANETNFALEQCRGDWCFYIQADEVVHEKDLEAIRKACEANLHRPEVEGLLFKYHHFFGDYEHYLPFHGWYRNEIRIVRNNAGVLSYKDAQSFRINGNKKLRVREINAHIYHYGWVRPPHLMQAKKKEHDSMHHGKEKTEKEYRKKEEEFNFGALGNIPLFKGTHPALMRDFIRKISWKDKLNYTKKARLERPRFKHEKLKYRLLSLLENKLNRGRDFAGYSNWKRLRR
jgi:glycosyltransferase involved in cell wall biosynthesis